ncbi:hypothetical protein LNV08_22055 [Paucibacter sp. TC2R-5]|uniref:hypothetical protein n=1 Tax=Paucibacter sp. TC2R-5 TaxID=2893555 RepID=UPI0021E5042A|nr:hypothetical protein [Paucibacter sp. TC2R-5]MCV2361658.1 hypothetical protein [Paucibacter sp. TC2R-5]
MMKLESIKFLVILGAAGAAGLYIWQRGGIAQAAAGAGAAMGGAVVDAAGGAVTGVVTGASQAVGIPTPAQTTTDAAVARWIIDNAGYWEASKWCGLPALLKGAAMDAGTGSPPPAQSAAGREFLNRAPPQASYDETDRLAKRYPSPSQSQYETGGRYAGSGSGAADERSFSDLSNPNYNYWPTP